MDSVELPAAIVAALDRAARDGETRSDAASRIIGGAVTGGAVDPKRPACPKCGGSGQHYSPSQQRWESCPQCGGSGRYG